MNANRNASAIVFDTNKAITMNNNRNFSAKTSQGLINGVIDHLKNHVVQTRTVIGVANVHSGAFLYCFQPFVNF